MNAYKVDAVVTANGLTILNGLPLPIGDYYCDSSTLGVG
jgi:hypothetical protein